MPATHGAGIRSPFDVQGLFGGSKKLVQRFTLDTTPPAHVKVRAWLPRRRAGESILCWLLPLSVLSCAEHRFPDFTLSWWQKGEIEQRQINGSELSEGPEEQGCTEVFQPCWNRAVRARLRLVFRGRRSHCLGAWGPLRELRSQAEEGPSGRPTGVRAQFAWLCFRLLAAVLPSLIPSLPRGVGFKDGPGEDGVQGAEWGQDWRHMEGEGGCVHLETAWWGNHASCFSALRVALLLCPQSMGTGKVPPALLTSWTLAGWMG